jgi:hypothetical protein
LFVFGTKVGGRIRLDTLYSILGISPRHGRQSLNRALNSINTHLKQLTVAGMLKRAGLPRKFENAHLPLRFELAASRDGHHEYVAIHAVKEVAEETTKPTDVDDEPSVKRRAS